MRGLDAAPFVDLFDEGFRADPAAAIDLVRAQGPVARTALGCLVVTREHVHGLLADPRLKSSLLQLARLQGVTEGRLYDMLACALLSIDGDDHARLRRLVSRSFTPQAANRYRPRMRSLVDDLIDRFQPAGECEFMSAFADHYPVQVICELLGAPAEDHELFGRWGDALTYVLSLELSLHLDEVQEALDGLYDYIDRLIGERQVEPRDDLLSQLISASDEGDRLSPLELRTMIGSLLFAVYDTTRNQLGLAMTVFCDHPDQWRLLAERPELAAPAVEEVMRVFGTVSVTPRLAMEDVDVAGWHIPAGTLVTLDLAAANYDPAAFDDPHGFDITAERQPQLTFGGGPHYCLGANLARAEMQEALPILARRLPDVALAGEPEWRPATGIYGPTRLPLRFSPTGTATVGTRSSTIPK